MIRITIRSNDSRGLCLCVFWYKVFYDIKKTIWITKNEEETEAETMSLKMLVRRYLEIIFFKINRKYNKAP